MASIETRVPDMTILTLRRRFRHGTAMHQTHLMLYAAGLTALGLVGVAASLVTLL